MLSMQLDILVNVSVIQKWKLGGLRFLHYENGAFRTTTECRFFFLNNQSRGRHGSAHLLRGFSAAAVDAARHG